MDLLEISVKKVVFVLFFVLLSPFCFAQQNLISDVEFYSGIPFMAGIGTSDILGKEVFRSAYPAFTYGFGVTNFSLFGDNKIGVFFNFNSHYTKSLKHDFYGDTIHYYQGNIATANNFQYGIVFHPFEKGDFKFPLALGFHNFIISASGSTEQDISWQFQKNGFGIYASMGAELHLNESIYFFSRLQVALDFLTVTNIVRYSGVPVFDKTAFYIDQFTYMEIGIYSTIAPVVGFGLKINGLFK